MDVDILNNIFILICIVIAVESITEIITSSTVFFKFRTFLSKKSEFFGSLINCGYCMSVWVSLFAAMMYYIGFVGINVVDFFISVFLYHRLSNVFHELMSRWFSRHPLMLFINFNREQNERTPAEDES